VGEVKKKSLKIFWWLAGLVALLLLPSVLLASLWVRSSIDEVRRVEHALNGLVAIKTLFPIIKSRTEHDFSVMNYDWINRVDKITDDPERLSAIKDVYYKAIGEFSDVQSLAATRKLVGMVAKGVKLNGVTPPDITGIANIITNHALVVAEQSLLMIQVARRLKKKDELNPWDRMSLPVQGGQFKVTADTIARFSRNEFHELPANSQAILKAPAEAYLKANLAFQQAAGSLIRSIYSTQQGSDLKIEALNSVYPELARANNALWVAAIKVFENGLLERKNVLSATLLVTTVVGIFSIIFALVGGIAISRAFASRTQQEMDSIGYHDPLTGLPNRRSLIKMLDHLMDHSKADRNMIGVLNIDLKRFKAINDTYGETVGDGFLRHIVGNLTRNACRNDIVARTGGNEFIVICQRFSRLADLMRLAEKIIQDISAPANIDGHMVQADVYIGLTQVTAQATGSQQVLMDAALALKAVKTHGTEGYKVFEPAMRKEFEIRNAIADDLRLAMEKGYIEPWFQPQICINSGAIIGFESLVRWVDPERGLISPAAFLPAAEAVGLMEGLDRILRKKNARIHQKIQQ